MIETLCNIYFIACASYIGYAVVYEFIVTFGYVTKTEECLADLFEAVKEYLEVFPNDVIEPTKKTPKHSFFLGKLFNVIERFLGIEDDGEDNHVIPEKPEIPFVEKYLKEFKEMPDPCEELSKEKLDSLKNNIVMELTPLGNVIMYYDADKESFSYYSDSTIPYRYLEVIGRKYVITFQCKQLFLDMAEVLKEAETKKQLKKDEAAEESKQSVISDEVVKKKSVFAKFKSYNTDNSKSVVTESTPKKNAVSIKQKVNEDAILKEKVNRYTHYGKLSNFSFLKKALKTVGKLTFSEFKIRNTLKNPMEHQKIPRGFEKNHLDEEEKKDEKEENLLHEEETEDETGENLLHEEETEDETGENLREDEEKDAVGENLVHEEEAKSLEQEVLMHQLSGIQLEV